MGKKLPKGWVETKLGTISKIVTGNTPSKQFDEYYTNGNIPWVKPGDINQSVYVNETEEYLSELGFSKARCIPKDSIMVTCIGNLGNIAIANCNLATNQQINSIVIQHDKVHKKFTYYNALLLKPWLIENSTSTTISMVNKGKFETAPFFLPPFAEQERIADKLDNLFDKLDRLRTSLDKVPKLLKDFRQQVLNYAVTGKLTEQWREGKELTLEKLTTKVGSGSTPKGGSETYQSDGIPLIRSMNVHFNGIKYDGLAFINEEQAEKLKNVEVRENDVLLNITGASIGRVCLAPKELSGARVNQHVCIIRCKEDKINPRYLNIYLASPIIQNIIANENYGVTRQAFTKVQTLNLKVPDLDLKTQSEIVHRVESLLAKADQIEERYQDLARKIKDLPQALLHKAFKGELVEQLPTDGDARELLEEIQKLKVKQ